jgi:hypothetical protein
VPFRIDAASPISPDAPALFRNAGNEVAIPKTYCRRKNAAAIASARVPKGGSRHRFVRKNLHSGESHRWHHGVEHRIAPRFPSGTTIGQKEPHE